MVLDDRDFLVRLEQAEASLASARSSLDYARANTGSRACQYRYGKSVFKTIDAQIEAAKITLWRAKQDYDRYTNLIKDHSITQQQYEQALAAAECRKQVAVLEGQKATGLRQTNATTVQSEATATPGQYSRYGYPSA